MISVEEAKEIILNRKLKNPPVHCDLESALGYYVAEDIFSPSDHPAFDQTAVDGYAFRWQDFAAGSPLKLMGETKAGDAPAQLLPSGSIHRIFTGAPIPLGSDTVVMQEFVTAELGEVWIQDEKLQRGGNIRKRSEQIQKGQIALSKGTVLSPFMVGFLASIGINRVMVSPKPRVSIIVTGNEFANSMEDLSKGKIFESNGKMISCALAELGIQASFQTCIDDLDHLAQLFRQEAAANDLVIITGGVSVGDYDFTRPVLESENYEIYFHKINQQPGKPVLYAGAENKFVFGLPGNPRSAIVCFYEYVLPWIRNSQGANSIFLTSLSMRLVHPIQKKNGRAQFLSGRTSGRNVALTGIQGSHMLQSFTEANCLVYLPESVVDPAEGDLVEVHMLF